MRFPAPLRLDTLRSAPLDTLGYVGLLLLLRLLLQAVVLPGISGLTSYGGGRGSPAVILFVEFPSRVVFTAVQPRPRLPLSVCVSSPGAKH